MSARSSQTKRLENNSFKPRRSKTTRHSGEIIGKFFFHFFLVRLHTTRRKCSKVFFFPRELSNNWISPDIVTVPEWFLQERECNLRWSKGPLRENRVLLRRRDDTRWRNEPRRAVAPSIIPARVGYPPSLISPYPPPPSRNIPTCSATRGARLRLILYPFLHLFSMKRCLSRIRNL